MVDTRGSDGARVTASRENVLSDDPREAIVPSLRRAPLFLVGALSAVSVWPIASVEAATKSKPVPVAVVSTVAPRAPDTEPPPVEVLAGDGSDGDGTPSGGTLVVGDAAWQCPVPLAKFTNDWGSVRSGGRRHEGTDLLALRGTQVVAPVGGVLRQHDTSAMAGHAFYLAGDDGVEYFGAHLDAYVASNGRVERGTIIGLVGDSGNAKGTTHLHFEIHPTKKSKINPFFTLDAHCR